MYEFFKKLLPVAEEIGTIQFIVVGTDDEIWGDAVKIVGVTNDGSKFEFELTITKEAKNAP